MNDDERFAENLRAQVNRVAPKISVDATRVVPAARRRRAAQIGGVTLAMGLVLGGGAWAATTMDAPGTALPGGSMTVDAEPSPKPSGPPITSSEGDPLTELPTYPAVEPVVPPDGWRDATYFHVVTRGLPSQTGGESGREAPLGSRLGSESWYGNGVSFELTTDGPALMAIGDHINIEGHTLTYTWADMAALPTDPEPLHDALLSRYFPGEREEAVRDAAARLATQAPASPELRAAAWELLTSLADVEVKQDARDSENRQGTAATYQYGDDDRVRTVIYDEARNLPLETQDTKHGTDVYLTTEFTDLPDEVADSAIEVPEFTAMTVEDAGVACQQAHLTCTFEDTESDTVPEGTVISSDPAAGALVTWGAVVTLQLSTGS
ncbi:PASTA domain-containing protein [Promicromonospora umidemergens]|uniref:PASTA domain-containing protein n=1 Tax=Promicromonospora umidemergens TaxID=629679 RepID=A0ABP8XTZ4_9MICO|nr:PASTA domain-containing protein [Promicromonospora umidemergens]MCP2286420.1 PASTA domain-containing protein [Promicromonospora umidemergens]